MFSIKIVKAHPNGERKKKTLKAKKAKKTNRLNIFWGKRGWSVRTNAGYT